MNTHCGRDPWRCSIAGMALVALVLANVGPSQAQGGIAPIKIQSTSKAIVAPTRYAWCCELSPDETWLVASHGFFQGDVGRIRVWDLKTGEIRSVASETRGVRRVAASPDGSIIASGNYGGEGRLRDAAEIASSSGDGTVRSWSAQCGEIIISFNAWNEQFAPARSVGFSPDGKTLASGEDDRTIKLWNAQEQKEMRVLTGQSLPVTSLVFINDNSLLVSATGDWRNNRMPGELRLWEATSGKELGQLRGSTSEIKCIAIDKGGGLLASTESNSILGLWDLTNRSLVRTVRLETVSASLAFSRDGQRLATGHYKGGITLWEVPALTPIQHYAGHTKGILGIAFSADGKFLATTGTDEKLAIWPVE